MPEPYPSRRLGRVAGHDVGAAHWLAGVGVPEDRRSSNVVALTWHQATMASAVTSTCTIS